MEINLLDYELVAPSEINKIKGKERSFIDIEVKDDHTFFIIDENENLILTHNCDGDHIIALAINFFYSWFPKIIEAGRLYKLDTPIATTGVGKTKKYYSTLTEFGKSKVKNNVRYLKGLGSLSIEDWEYVFKTQPFSKILLDKESKNHINIAFGNDANLRKQFLK